MLADLGRNDIGKIAQNNSVEVTMAMEVGYRHVMHLTSGSWSASPQLTAMDAPVNLERS